MSNYMELISVPAIATVVYWMIEIIKYTVNGSEKFKRLIPITSALIGAILGVCCYYIIPDLVIADNVLVALIIGAVSGLTATGTHQIFKQLNK